MSSFSLVGFRSSSWSLLTSSTSDIEIYPEGAFKVIWSKNNGLLIKHQNLYLEIWPFEEFITFTFLTTCGSKNYQF